MSLPGTVTIALTNVDEPGNEKPWITDTHFTVQENTANGSTVGTVTGTDIDAGDSLVYTLTAGNSDPDGDGKLAFAINPASGVITVNDKGDLDFETTPNFSLTVTATDTGGLSDEATIKVVLKDINDPVQWKVADGGNGHYYQAVLISEGISWDAAKTAAEAAGGHLATITSAEENSFVYSLVRTHSEWSGYGPWLGGFQPPNSLEPNGNWQWITGEPFSYSNWNSGEPNNGLGDAFGENAIHYYGNTTWNDQLHADSPYAEITGYIIEIENIPYAFTVPENSNNTTVVGVIDKAGLDNPTFTITEGNTDPDGDSQPAFIIDATTGAITVNDSGDLNFETTPRFTLAVAATSGTVTLPGTVTIDLTNVDEPGNEKPWITDTHFTVQENTANGSIVGTVIGTDIDAGDSLVYTLTAGNSDPDGDGKLAFAINPASGVITVNDKGDLDFETTPNFTLTVTATDTGGLSDEATIKVALTDINDPVQWKVADGGNGHFYQVISVPAGLSWSAAKSAAEAMGGHLATITSAKENGFINKLTNLSSYSDSWWLGGFQPSGSLEPAGNWQWITSEVFNYSNWAGGEPNNSGQEDFLQLYAESHWNDLTNQAGVPGYILEIENIPYAFTVPENSADATVVGVIDKAGLDNPTFTITEGNTDPDHDGNPAFAIDNATGQITVNDSGDLDFETTRNLTLTVIAEEGDGLSLTNTVHIALLNADEPGNETPEVQDANFAVGEGFPQGTPVGTVSASDVDPGDTLTYTIVGGNTDTNGNGQAAFTIDAATGKISVNDSQDLDFEASPTFVLGVQVSDAGGLSDNATVTVALRNLTEIGGTDRPDTLRGTAGNDQIRGLAGNDILRGLAGDDLLAGGTGTDTLREQGDVDFVLTDTRLTGLGTDTLVGIERAILTGGDHANILDASTFTLGPVVLNGGRGDDTLTAPSLQPTVASGPNILSGGEGHNTLIGGQGFDAVREQGDLDFMLSDRQLTGTDTASGTVVIQDALTNIERAYLVGGAGANKLDASRFTGHLVVLEGGAGDDELIGGIAMDRAKAQADANLTLTDAHLTGLGTDTLTHIDRGELIGGVGDNILDASGFTNGSVILEGREGHNTLIGGHASDTVRERGNLDFVLTDSLLTGQDDAATRVISDTLSSIERAYLIGGAGDNRLDASGFHGQLVVLEGGQGDDELIGGGAINQARAVGNVDFVLTDTQLVGLGTDTLTDIDHATLIGGGSANLIDASAFHGRVELWGEAGDDTLKGGMNNDLLSGGAGNDTLYGGDGTDRVLASGDSDFTLADLAASDPDYSAFSARLTGMGSDLLQDIEEAALVGGSSANTLDASGFFGHLVILEGQGGDDTLIGRAAASVVDQVKAVGDTDFTLVDTTLTSGLGTDTLIAIDQATLTGGAGDNRLDASAFTLGKAILSGASGNDTLLGGTANDGLFGGSGDDVLNGGAGKDSLTGGEGADTFVFGMDQGGADWVNDFLSGTDRLRFLDDASGLDIGNGDHVIDHATLADATGAFSKQAELVILTPNISGSITADSAAALIGAATEAYAIDDVRLFCVDNGTNSALYLFQSAGEDAEVSATELTLIGTLYRTAQTELGDYAFA